MRTHLGITVMLKGSIIMVVLVTVFVYIVVHFDQENETYWETVGPRWDRMLNPCKYQTCD